MGKDHYPWHQVPHSPWGFGTLNCGNNLGPPTTTLENTNSMVFPVYLDPFGAAAFSVKGAAPFPLYHNPKSASFGLQETTSSQRKFMACDQSRNQTSLIFTSAGAPLMTSQGAVNPLHMDLQGSNETNVTDGNGVEEMHEDTEEIDALLYSDSEDYVDEKEAKEEEEEASTGHSPIIISKERSVEEVASSKTLPTKKRRLDSELDASLVDTASSARVYCDRNDGDVESSCVGAGEKREGTGDEHEKEEEEEEGEEISTEPTYYPNKRIKRERIRETVGLLRRIIPGSKGKDAATILDEAISYLKSLKLKTTAFGAASATTSAL